MNVRSWGDNFICLMNGPHSRHNALKFLGALPGILHIEPGAGVGRLDAIRSAVQGESEGGLFRALIRSRGPSGRHSTLAINHTTNMVLVSEETMNSKEGKRALISTRVKVMCSLSCSVFCVDRFCILSVVSHSRTPLKRFIESFP